MLNKVLLHFSDTHSLKGIKQHLKPYIMKKLILIALAFVLGTASMKAAGEPDVTKEEIRNQIVHLLDSPHHYFEKEMDIKVYFTFDSDGRVVITKLDTDSYAVKKFFRENLNFKKLQRPGQELKKYDVLIKLRPS